MDFFERQDKARRNTKLLVVYFTLAVALLIVAVYLACALIFLVTGHNLGPGAPSREALWNPQLFFGVAVATSAVIAIGSVSKTLELAQGGSAVAVMLGGQAVNPNTTDPDERRLLNVVEEMAIASGTPVPQVYVLPGEQGINAFAAGHSPSDAVIGVTHGGMKLLTRDELQGVIGHEFSHILNGDMRLNLRLIGIIFGILCLTVVGRVLLRTRGRRNPLPLLGLALLLIGAIGVFFGRLIQAAVSRQREFLADASAVQFTRDPAGLAGALKKIGGLSYGSRLESAHADEASHLFFGNGMGDPLFGLMATHPPLEERIRALDPSFDGKFPVVQFPVEERRQPARPAESLRPVRPPRLEDLLGARVAAAASAAGAVSVQTILPSIGQPMRHHLRYAKDLHASFSETLKIAARDPMSATALIYALLLSRDEATRTAQLQLLAPRTSPAICQETGRLLPDAAAAASAKLPLVNLTLPALRRLSPAQFQQFGETVRLLIESDRQIDLFEYVLQKIVLRHLEPHFKPVRKAVVQFYSVKPLLPDCSILLSALAHAGQGEALEIENAFRQGALQLHAPEGQVELLPRTECGLTQIDAALNRLAQAAPQLKKNVLDACAQTVAADGVIQEQEAELLRAIADTLDCPIPPFVQME